MSQHLSAAVELYWCMQELKPDGVLVDGRFGHDHSCILTLPDKLIEFLFNPY